LVKAEEPGNVMNAPNPSYKIVRQNTARPFLFAVLTVLLFINVAFATYIIGQEIMAAILYKQLQCDILQSQQNYIIKRIFEIDSMFELR